MSDLHVYVGSAQTLLAGGSLYDFVSFNGDRFVYPPFAGLAFAPLLVVGEPALRVLWTLAQCAEVVLLAAVVVARGNHPLLRRAGAGVTVPVVACLLLLSQPVFTGLFLGQVSLLVVVLVLLDALEVTPARLRGVPTGLAAAVKLTPLAFVPYLWFTGRRRAAVVATLTFATATALAALVLPEQSRWFWSHGLGPAGFIDLAQADNQSLRGVAARLGWSGDGGGLLLATSALVLLLAYRRSGDLHQQGQWLAGAVVVGAAVVLVSPISWSHHQTPLVLAAACAVGGSGRRALAWAAGIVLLTSFPVQLALPSIGPPLDLLTSNTGALLALLLLCWAPFGPGTGSAQAGRVTEWRAGSRYSG
jgi:alpha-1,2-mannosyltransferase